MSGARPPPKYAESEPPKYLDATLISLGRLAFGARGTTDGSRFFDIRNLRSASTSIFLIHRCSALIWCTEPPFLTTQYLSFVPQAQRKQSARLAARPGCWRPAHNAHICSPNPLFHRCLYARLGAHFRCSALRRARVQGEKHAHARARATLFYLSRESGLCPSAHRSRGSRHYKMEEPSPAFTRRRSPHRWHSRA